jgi:hypothetical protein
MDSATVNTTARRRGRTPTGWPAGTIVVTVVAGPLNYAGVNPKISCHTPQPSR